MIRAKLHMFLNLRILKIISTQLFQVLHFVVSKSICFLIVMSDIKLCFVTYDKKTRTSLFFLAHF